MRAAVEGEQGREVSRELGVQQLGDALGSLQILQPPLPQVQEGGVGGEAVPEHRHHILGEENLAAMPRTEQRPTRLRTGER